ncbi:MAG TPA: sugar transferase [Sphingomicrobium sp.]|nr:sugar transferase [Sphingomicrobium sp.]
MAKRLSDILLAAASLLLAAPLLAVLALLIWAFDGRSPLYQAVRVGRGNRDFRMLKLRTMTADAELLGGTSTTLSDQRITPLGHMLRRWKLDELPQLVNVLRGDMSIVGPRPNTRRGGVDHYTAEEMRLLTLRPGITDIASITFSDEADILHGSADPDALYNAVIRPWKSRLGLLYIDRRSLGADLYILWLTIVAIVAKRAALQGVGVLLERWGADQELRRICLRTSELPHADPPGLAA